MLTVAVLTACGSDRVSTPARIEPVDDSVPAAVEPERLDAAVASTVPQEMPVRPPPLPDAPELPARPQSLEVTGYNPASHVAPDDYSHWPKPVVIVLHGNFDRPEWECSTWREVAGFYGWVLCPRGVRTPWASLAEDRWTYRGSGIVRSEIEAAMSALENRYPGRVSRKGTVLVGFSLGANLAPAIARDAPGVYPYVFLVEGGGKNMERKWIAAFKRAGVRGVGLAMSLPGLRHKATQALPRFKKAGIRAVFVDMRGAGHNYRDDFGVTGKQALAELVAVDGDAGPEP